MVNAGNGQIALHSRSHNRFARMNSRGAMVGSPSQFAHKLSRKWTWERFTVVSAGNGEIALHNKVHNRFVRMTRNAKIGVSPRKPAQFLPKSWTWERFRIVQSGRCKIRKRKVPKRKKVRRRRRRIHRKRRSCPRGCRAARKDPTVNLRQFIKAGKGDFTVKLIFKLKRRSFTSAAIVFSGGNRVGLDPLYTSRSAGGWGSWRARRQYGRGPRPMLWHCLVLRRKMGKVSGFLNGRFIFSRPMTDTVSFVDLAAVRNVMWVKDFVLKRGWHAGLSCRPGCGLKLGGLLQTSTRNAQGLPAPVGSLLWRVNLLSTDSEGKERHHAVKLIGSSREGFLLAPLDKELHERRQRPGLEAEVAAAKAVLRPSTSSSLDRPIHRREKAQDSKLKGHQDHAVHVQPSAKESVHSSQQVLPGIRGKKHRRLLLRSARPLSDLVT